MKIDVAHNLLYVKGCMPGTDDQYIRIRDALRKGWHNKCFPQGLDVPFPTYIQSTTAKVRKVAASRELLPPPPPLDSKDPLARARREVEK